MSVEWIQVLLGIAATAIIGLVAAVWIMLKERISLLRDEFNRRFADQDRQREAEAREIKKEIEILRKARHNLVDRLSAVETFLKYFVPTRRPKLERREEEDEDGM